MAGTLVVTGASRGLGAASAVMAGLKVVVDRCTKIEYLRLLGD